MWMFTLYGFFSVVCARKQNGDPDPSRMMIRARNIAHLELLRRRFRNTTYFKGCTVKASDNTDYPYRIFISKERWLEVAGVLQSEINFDNFKAEVMDFTADDPKAPAYLNLLHDVWQLGQDYGAAIHTLQAEV